MLLSLGLTYTFLKSDGTMVTFKFQGHDDCIVDGRTTTLYELLSGGFLAYWEDNE